MTNKEKRIAILKNRIRDLEKVCDFHANLPPERRSLNYQNLKRRLRDNRKRLALIEGE